MVAKDRKIARTASLVNFCMRDCFMVTNIFATWTRVVIFLHRREVPPLRDPARKHRAQKNRVTLVGMTVARFCAQSEDQCRRKSSKAGRAPIGMNSGWSCG